MSILRVSSNELPIFHPPTCWAIRAFAGPVRVVSQSSSHSCYPGSRRDILSVPTYPARLRNLPTFSSKAFVSTFVTLIWWPLSTLLARSSTLDVYIIFVLWSYHAVPLLFTFLQVNNRDYGPHFARIPPLWRPWWSLC